MSRIISMFNPDEKIFQTAMPLFGIEELKTFYNLFKMDLEKDAEYEKTGRYLLLGRIVLCLIPQTIRKLKEEDPSFQITDVYRLDPSYGNGGIKENLMCLDDTLVFRIQIRHPGYEEGEFIRSTCQIEISKEDNYIVFSGLFKLFEKK